MDVPTASRRRKDEKRCKNRVVLNQFQMIYTYSNAPGTATGMYFVLCYLWLKSHE